MQSHSVDEPVACSWSEGAMSNYIISFCHFVLSKCCFYLRVVNHNKSASRIQKHLGKIILSLKIHPAVFLAESRATCQHVSHRSQITPQSVGLTLTQPVSSHSNLLSVTCIACHVLVCFINTTRKYLLCPFLCRASAISTHLLHAVNFMMAYYYS